jgi:hypothetical protein
MGNQIAWSVMLEFDSLSLRRGGVDCTLGSFNA